VGKALKKLKKVGLLRDYLEVLYEEARTATSVDLPWILDEIEKVEKELALK